MSTDNTGVLLSTDKTFWTSCPILVYSSDGKNDVLTYFYIYTITSSQYCNRNVITLSVY
jgi:hypothetical protein